MSRPLKLKLVGVHEEEASSYYVQFMLGRTSFVYFEGLSWFRDGLIQTTILKNGRFGTYNRWVSKGWDIEELVVPDEDPLALQARDMARAAFRLTR